MPLTSMEKQVHFPQDKWCDDTDPLWRASWSKITQHISPLAGEASPRSLFHNSSIPQVLIKIYWIIFAKLNGPSYSNYQLLNVTARDVARWLAFLFKRIVPPPPTPLILSLHFFKNPNRLNVLTGLRGGKKNKKWPYTYNDCFFLGPLGASLVAQTVKRLPTMWETQVRYLGQEDPLEKEMATHYNILAWKIPWTEDPGRLQSMGSQSRTRLSDFTFTFRTTRHWGIRILNTWSCCESEGLDWRLTSEPPPRNTPGPPIYLCDCISR